jgi:hypothetical protein
LKFDDLKLVLGQIGVDVDGLMPRAPNQVQIPCPLAEWLHKSGTDSHPSLSIRFDVAHEWTKFKCWTCKEQGKIWNLVDSYGELAKDDKAKDLALKLIEGDKPSLSARFGVIAQDLDTWVKDTASTKAIIMSEDCLAPFAPAYHHKQSADYLAIRRKVTKDQAEFWDLRYDMRSNRIVFPVRTAKNDLVGAVGRVMDDKTQPRYYNYFGFNAGRTLGGLHQIKSTTSKMMVVEGFFDLIRGYPWAAARDASIVCTWRAEMTPKQAELILALDKLVSIWYDLDDAGTKGWDKARKLMEDVTYGLRRATWSGDFDVGAMDETSFNSIWKSLWR